MFKYIKTLKCGQTKNIYFTKHDIDFTKLMLILQNINLELKSALRTKYLFYQTLLYLKWVKDNRKNVRQQGTTSKSNSLGCCYKLGMYATIY